MTTIYHFNLLIFLSLISRLSGCCLSSTHSGSKQRHHVHEQQKSYFQQRSTCVASALFFRKANLSTLPFSFTFSILSFSFLLQFYLCNFSMIYENTLSVLEITESMAKGSWNLLHKVSGEVSEEKLLLWIPSSEHSRQPKWWAQTRFQKGGIFPTPYWDLKHRKFQTLL